MTHFTKNANGKYVVKGKTYDMLIGTRAQVWHGTAYKTSGGLNKNDLHQNKSGRIVSKAKYHSAKKEMRLVKAGYGTKKGKFGYVKLNKSSKRGGNMLPAISGGKSRRRSRRNRRGGSGVNFALSPSPFDGQGVGTSGVDIQFVAGNAA